MTNNYLPYDDFVPYAPKEPGQVHVHHCKQGHGKNKLYIRRCDNGNIIAFCHHCHSSGFYSSHHNLPSNGSSYPETDGNVSRNSDTAGSGRDSFSIPADCEGRAGYWPNEALTWITKYLTPDQVSDSPLTYSPSKRGIIFPLINEYYPHTLVGWQLRSFPEKEPKYMTYKNKSIGLDIPVSPFYTAFSDTLVITEDWISAYKIGLAGYEGVPILGSSMKQTQFQHCIAREYKRYVIALDNDNPHVRREQRYLLTRFSAYAPTLLLKLSKDLKEYSLDDIKDLLV